MPIVDLVLLGLLAVFFLLLLLRLQLRTRRLAFAYGRWTLLCLGALVVLAPFAWLLAAIFKDHAALNEYAFFPPLDKWSPETMNLKNFRELFKAKPSLRGPVYFWEYVLNSTVYATVTSSLQILFSSLSGYALAKYEFRGKSALTLFMLGSMMIPSVLLLAPLYEMIVGLGLVDTYSSLFLPYLAVPYGIFLFRQSMSAALCFSS